MSFAGSNWRVIHAHFGGSVGHCGGKQQQFYRLSVPRGGSSLSIKKGCLVYVTKEHKKGRGRRLRFILRPHGVLYLFWYFRSAGSSAWRIVKKCWVGGFVSSRIYGVLKTSVPF